MEVQEKLTKLSKNLRKGARILACRGSKYNFMIPDFNFKDFAKACKEAADIVARVGKAAKVFESVTVTIPTAIPEVCDVIPDSSTTTTPSLTTTITG